MFSINGGSYVAGTSPYTFSALAVGNYSIKVKDVNTCESVAQSVTLTQPAAIIVNTIPTAALCHGGNGSAALSATGGNNSYTFASSVGGTVVGSVLTAPAGTYTITATDGNGCAGTGSVTIGQPTAPLGFNAGIPTNVLCKGGATGAATVTVGGGTSPYTYAWTGANGFTATGATITGLLAGTYNVTVKDANNCTANGAVTVTEPVLVTSITAPSNATVCEASALNLTSTPTSSTGGLTYAWSGPNTFTAATQNASITATTLAAAGTYTVTVTDGNSCVASATTTVVINPLPSDFTVTGTGAICNGVAAPISLSGSQTGINYKLETVTFSYNGSVISGNGSALTFTPPSSPTGVYTIKATNTVTGCTRVMTGSVTTTISTNPTLNITSQTNVSCFGGNDGAVTVVASSGTGTYNYAFNGGSSQPTGVFNSKSAGTFPVTATDASTGCVGTINVTLTEPTSLPSATVAIAGIACVGNTVTLTATAIGGTAGYMYNWNGTGFVASNTLAVTTSGVNTLVVRDSKGCISTATVSTNVTFNALPVPVIVGATTVCSGATLGLTANDGVTYVWSGPNSFTSTTAAISIANAQVANAGTYIVTVTNANSCVATATANVIVNQPPTVSIANTGLALSCTTPTTSVTASGASTYAWSGDGGFTATTATASITAGGTYTVIGTSANGCTASASVVITENKTTPTVTIANTGLALSCTTPTTSVTASGASTYAWTGDGGFTATTALASITAGGTYTVIGTSANGCTASASVVITENKTTPTMTIANTGLALSCTTPTTSVTASGASTYAWSGDGGFTATTATASITAGGTYTVIGTNANGCTASASVVIMENKTTPTMTIANTGLALSCTTPTTSVTASGASTYAWSGDGGFTATTATASITAGGTYTVIGTSANGCTASTSVVITENKVVPTVTVSASTFILTCLTPSTTITASGANTYAWTGPGGFTATTAVTTITAGGTYTVIGMNANGCTASARVVIGESKASPTITVTPTTAVLTCVTPSTTITASGANTSYAWSGTGGFTATTALASITAGGTYTVIGTNGNGCTASASIVITENKTTPTVTVSSATATINCTTPTTSILASGADTYSWTGAGGFTATTASASITAGGTYTVVGTSTANGCTASASVVITENKVVPTVTIANTGLALSCTTPTTSVTASGASTYAWSGDGGFTATTATASITAGGTCTVIGTSANGCTASASVVITENKTTPTVTITNTGLALSCTTPTTSVTASGASTYAWSGDGGFTATTVTASITTGGTYTVIGTNANGCTASASVVITENKVVPTVTIANTGLALSCTTPTTSVTASGASTYAWSGDGGFTATTVTASITAGGTYTVIGTNANGCTASASVVITENKVVPTANVTPSSAILTCINQTATLVASGIGTYAWVGPNGFVSTSTSITTNQGGTYTLTVTGTNGCTASASAIVIENNATPTVNVTPTSAILTCTNPTVTLTASGIGTYAWVGPNSFTSTSAAITTNQGGTYTVTATGSNGCTASASVVITENQAVPTATATGGATLCSGSTINLTATGGGTYAWSGPNSFTSTSAGVTIPNATVANSGTYTVTISSSNGCTATATTGVLVNPAIAPPTAQADVTLTPGGDLTLTATGCTGTLLWFKTSDNTSVTMPISPSVTTSYYAKCQVTTNSVTCTSPNSGNVIVTVGVVAVISIKTGNWEDPTTWSVGRLPLVTEDVTIDSTHIVTITTPTQATAKKLIYKANSTVKFGNTTAKLTLGSL